MTFSLEEAKQLQKSGRNRTRAGSDTCILSLSGSKRGESRIAKGELGKLRRVYVEYTQGWLSERIELLGATMPDGVRTKRSGKAG